MQPNKLSDTPLFTSSVYVGGVVFSLVTRVKVQENYFHPSTTFSVSRDKTGNGSDISRLLSVTEDNLTLIDKALLTLALLTSKCKVPEGGKHTRNWFCGIFDQDTPVEGLDEVVVLTKVSEDLQFKIKFHKLNEAFESDWIELNEKETATLNIWLGEVRNKLRNLSSNIRASWDYKCSN